MSSAKKEAKKAAKAAAKQEKAEAKAAKKAADPAGSASLRDTVIKSVTAFVCVIALCVSSVVAINNYSDAIVKAAEVAPAPSSNSSASADNSAAAADNSAAAADDTAAAADDTAAAADDTAAAADDTAAAADDTAAAADNTAAAADNSSSSASSSSAAPASSSNDPTSFTKAQAVEYYNNSIKNAAKAPKLKAVKKENTALKIDSMKPNLTDLGNKIVAKYAVPKTKIATFENGKPTSGTEKTASEFLIKTRLEPAGAKSATVTKSGSNYLVTIHVVPEKATLNTKPKYNDQCVYPLDLNSVDLFGLKVTEADFTYPGTTLTALVNPQGLAVKTTADQPLSGTGGGKFVAVNVQATVSGKWTEQIDYTY